METYSPPVWLIVLAGVVFLGGIALRHWIGRRRFERTNQFGLEEFTSYEDLKIKRGAESCLGCLGLLAIFSGFVLGALWLLVRCSAS